MTDIDGLVNGYRMVSKWLISGWLAMDIPCPTVEIDRPGGHGAAANTTGAFASAHTEAAGQRQEDLVQL